MGTSLTRHAERFRDQTQCPRIWLVPGGIALAQIGRSGVRVAEEIGKRVEKSCTCQRM